MGYEKKHRDQFALELSEAEAGLIRFLRQHRAGYHQLIISWLGPHWCVETNDLRVDVPRGVGYGDTFEEAWSRVAARLEMLERDVANASSHMTLRGGGAEGLAP
jgi:hypothetical protein